MCLEHLQNVIHDTNYKYLVHFNIKRKNADDYLQHGTTSIEQ